jgi:RNA polymerase sigma-70 factor (ECF subfamily)
MSAGIRFSVGSRSVTAADLQEIIDQYFTRIQRAALVLTGNPWDADDLAQETFLVLAGRSNRFEGRSSLYTWLYGILLNLERQRRRRNGLRKSKLRILRGSEPSNERTAPSAETALEVAEWKRSLWGRVAELPDGQRQVLVLRFSEHLSYEEIAEVMDCPLGTVKSRIHHGLAALRASLLMSGDDAAVIPLHANEDLNHAI